MSDDKQPARSGFTGFLLDLMAGLARDLLKVVIAFVVGTGAGAIACAYYGLPMVLSLGGGILVVGIALALSMDSG
ncbi:MAG: hypothetical protein AAFO81_02530 [Pseudomonadota bacterium]